MNELLQSGLSCTYRCSWFKISSLYISNTQSQTAHGSDIPRLIDAQVSSAERNTLEVFSTTLLHARADRLNQKM
jgi:hypothetical protein